MDLDRIMTFDRWDFLLTKLLLIAVSAAITGTAVLFPALSWALGHDLIWAGSIGLEQPVRDQALIVHPGAEVEWSGAATYRIAEATPSVWLATLLPGLVLAAATILLAWLLLRLLNQLQSEVPFIRASVWWLRAMAVVLIIAPWLHLMAGAVANGVVQHAALSGDSALRLDIGIAGPLLLTALGLLVAAIAEAFGRASRLQDEVEGLV